MPEKKSFENSFKILSAALYVIRTHPFIPRNRVWLLQFLVLTIMNGSCLIFLTNSVFLHDAKSGNYVDASKNLAMLIVCFNSNMKYYTMLYYRDSIAGLIETIDRDYELANQLNEDEKNIILSYSKKGSIVSKLWVLVASATSSIFPVKAFYLMLYFYHTGERQLVPMFDLSFPYFIEQYKSTFWAFIGVFLLCFIFDCFAGLVYTGFEPLIPIFTLHICGQLNLLSLKTSKVISDSKNEKEMKENFKIINMKLLELYSFIDQVQNNFMLLIEFNMKTTTIVLPCNAFLLLQEYRNNSINVEYIFLTVASLVHFFIPCYYCDLLMESLMLTSVRELALLINESENFRQAIYKCGWENCRYISIRKTVLLMLTRASKPFCMKSIFFYVNLDTFSIMCRQGYAIFNLMTAAWT